MTSPPKKNRGAGAVSDASPGLVRWKGRHLSRALAKHNSGERTHQPKRAPFATWHRSLFLTMWVFLFQGGTMLHGNVFLEGETVRIDAGRWMEAKGCGWRAVDYENRVVDQGVLAEGEEAIRLGRLGVGYYRIEALDLEERELGWTSLAVLPAWKESPSPDSPVCVDAAIAWFARDDVDKQNRFARLAKLAGVGWVRDRMSWGNLEPQPGAFAEETTYDSSAKAQAEQGLRVLQVFHSTPPWAWDEERDGEQPSKRFPRDLRHIHDFCREMSARYRGQIQAWEPWNEANIEPFGGHPVDEMCSLQKAAYWGLKKGAPEILACWNVFAGAGTPLQTEGVLLNEVWPCFDTYSIHSYAGF